MTQPSNYNDEFTDDITSYSHVQALAKGQAKSAKVPPGILARVFIDSGLYKSTGQHIYKYFDGIYKKMSKEDLLPEIKESVKDDAVKASYVKEVRDLILMDQSIRIDEDQLNGNKHLINLANGVLDITSGQLLQHSLLNLTTVRIPVIYNPNEHINEFQKFLNQVLPDSNDQMRIQELFGYILTSYTEAEKMFILYGRPNTGKSTIIKVMESLLGKENYSNMSLNNVTEKFSIAHLHGKIANFDADLPETTLKETGTLKKLISGDRLKGEFKGIDAFFFKNIAKLVFGTNYIPVFQNESSEAMLRRIEIVEFNQQVPVNSIDPFLYEKLINERSAIFNWALTGLTRLIQNNFRFTSSINQKKYHEAFKMKNNSISYFIENYCKLGLSEMVPKTILYQAYKEFCDDHFLESVSNTKFYSALKSKCPQVEIKQIPSRNNERCFVGISLK